MTLIKCKLFFVVLLCTCALNYCRNSDKIKTPNTLQNAEASIISPESVLKETPDDAYVRNIAKRIVSNEKHENWPRHPSNIPSSSENSYNHQSESDSFNVHDIQTDSSIQFGQNSGYYTRTGNSKWKPTSGQNTFGKEDDEWYEGIPSGSEKPYHGILPAKIEIEKNPADIAAKYDPVQGVQCPTPDATGLFAYPLDCKFYVKCSNGQATVQSCTSGTHFSPERLECDVPNKVKCYGGQLADFTITKDYDDDGRKEHVIKLSHANSEVEKKKARCPWNLNGLMALPSECTKYLQCANGITYIRECGSGTVFNPILNICDWPQNVNGCEDLAVSKDDRTFARVKCPAEYSGLLPHPEICTEYLQCANGITYIRDCNPGTVFNPISFICDWPYNVPGCFDGSFETSVTDSPTYSQSSSGNRPIQQPSGSTHLYGWNVHGNQGHNHQSSASTDEQEHGHHSSFGGNTGSQWHSEGSGNQYVSPSGIPSYSQHQGSSSFNQQLYGPNHHQEYDYRGQHHSHNHPERHFENSNFDSQGEFSRPESDSRFAYKPNHEHTQTPSPSSHTYDINGHAYPYNPQSTNQNSPKKPSIFLEPPKESSEETNSSEAGRNYGQAWARPSVNNRSSAVSNDRSKYGRTNGEGLLDVKFKGDNNNHSNKSGRQNPQTGSFQPSSWRGMGSGFEQRPSYPGRGTSVTTEGPNLTVTNLKPYARSESPNIQNSNNRQWIPFPTRTTAPSHVIKIGHGTGMYSSANTTRGRYITKNPMILQGHSQTRTQSSQTQVHSPNSRTPKDNAPSASGDEHVMVIPPRKTAVWRPSSSTIVPEQLNITMITSSRTGASKKSNPKQESPEVFDSDERKEFAYGIPGASNIPTVTIELAEDWNSSLPLPSGRPTKEPVVEKKYEINTEYEDFAVEVESMDGTKQWRPQTIVFNKSKNKNNDDKSVVMRVNNRKRPSFLLEVELAPFLDDEPPFPSHYTPEKSASLVTDPFIPGKVTPLSGQVIRLRGGTRLSEGYVEVQGNEPGWGIVCDSKNGWTPKEADVVCKQLGYSRGALAAWQGRPKTSAVPKWIAANTVTCHGNETKFQFCKFTHEPDCAVEHDAVAVRCVPHRVAHCKGDEIPHNGHCYHFGESNQALSHSEAHDYCQRRESRLIDLIDQSENDFISELLIQNQPHVNSIITAGMGFTTFNRTIWMWEDSTVAKFKYTKWWPGWLGDKKSPPFAGSRPVCIVMKRKFSCNDRPENNCKTDYFFWDVEDCATSNKGHAFICERSYDDIGCVYGNGDQYFGNANKTSSGRACLYWSDPQVIRSLAIKVPNKEIHDELRQHNFCRNPNPNKESKPWCFTGARGEMEYCDIPHCGKILSKKSQLTGTCKPKHFECSPGNCIPSAWLCDGKEHCNNGADESISKCQSYMNFFKKIAKHKLDGYVIKKWPNTSAKTCATRCKEADFTCLSFTHQTKENMCYLSNSNIGMTGALVKSDEHNYYEMRDRAIDCNNMFVCANKKCINRTMVCDGKNDCIDRSDENICTVKNLDYEIRLAGAKVNYEGRIEVKILGKWGQVCENSFDLVDANVVCKELGYKHGALEVKLGGHYGNLHPPDAFMVDQLKCRGNESSIRECDFEGWGKHNCKPGEAVGVICKTNGDICQEGYWKCDNSVACIPTPYICDTVTDCPDGSDESPLHCDVPFLLRLANGSSPMEGRVEIRHHSIWGTVCDDNFSNNAAMVICRSLGYGGPAIVKKNGFFGPGTGPIWLDEVLCVGNETQLNRCKHDSWGKHDCDHNKDVGVVCSAGPTPRNYEVMIRARRQRLKNNA